MSASTSRLARRLVVLAIVLSLWEALARLGVLNPFYIPPPGKVAATLFGLFADGEIWTHIEATFGAALLGLVLGVMVGAILGVCAALVPQVGDFIAAGDPLFRVYKNGRSLSEDAFRERVALGQERTLEQDPAFAFRIIVDIASKSVRKK